VTEVQENIAVSKGQEENVIDRFIADGEFDRKRPLNTPYEFVL